MNDINQMTQKMFNLVSKSKRSESLKIVDLPNTSHQEEEAEGAHDEGEPKTPEMKGRSVTKQEITPKHKLMQNYKIKALAPC